MRNVVVGVYHHSPEEYLSIIEAGAPQADLRICREWDRIEDIVDDVEVLLAFKFGFRPFPRDRILAAGKLRWVQLASAGIDHICPYDPKRLAVTNASGIHGEIMSQYVIGVLVFLLWDFERLLKQQRERVWERYEVPSLAGKTVGILGLGSIGTALAAHAGQFGMRAVGTRRSGRPVDGVDEVYGPDGLHRVLEQSDFVINTLPRTQETLGLLGETELARMRDDAYLINISRGGIVDEEALLEVLRSEQIAGAVLDVFNEEPLPADSPFWTLPNAMVTPHISGELEHWPRHLAELFVRNLRRYLRSEELENIVDPELGY